MIPERFVQLIDVLLTKTKTKSLEWMEDSNTKHIILRSAASIVRIRSDISWGPDSNAEPPASFVEVALLQPNGDFVDSFEVYEGAGTPYKKCRELADLARAKARHVDETIASIIKDIDGPPF